MLEICEKQKCVGCGVCYNKCAKNAITMVENEEGFKYPIINNERCINCGKCIKICPINNDIKVNNSLEIFAVKNKDYKSRIKSRSGGFFPLICDIALKKGGVVYGAGFDDELNVRHLRIENIEDADKLRGSKYVNSDINDCYTQAKMDLDNGKFVVFSGTPCQIAGLKAYLNYKEYNNLVSVDLVCHGVPSHKTYKDYINFIKLKYNKMPNSFLFRDKIYGWNTHIETFVFGKKRVSSELYRNLFYSDLALRNSCYNCKFTNTNRVSDITLGDYWGIEVLYPKFNDNKGVSQILVNTEKGKNIFEKCLDKIDCIRTEEKNINYVLERQPCLKRPTAMPLGREEFWRKYNEFGFKYIFKRFGETNLKKKTRLKLKILRGYIRNIKVR